MLILGTLIIIISTFNLKTIKEIKEINRKRTSVRAREAEGSANRGLKEEDRKSVV